MNAVRQIEENDFLSKQLPHKADPDELVLDPFGGSFTSVIAAKKLGRIGIGIELNKKMFGKSSMLHLQKELQTLLFDNKEVHISEINLL